MGDQRIRIDKGLEKSSADGSIIVTNSAEANYMPPDTPNMLLNLNGSNIPEWTEDPTIDGECRFTRQLNGETGRILSIEADGLVNALGNLLLYTNMISVTSTPSVILGTGTGSSPGSSSHTILGTNDTGTIEITTSASPAANADIATVSFIGVSYPLGSSIILYPANSDSILLSVYAVGGTSDWILKSGSVPLVASTVYKWNYIVRGF